jgi:hypothetical protein
MALTVSFLFDFESEMMVITENEFARISASDVLWYRDIAKVRTTGKRREIIAWLISNAQIYDGGPTGGGIRFDDMMAVTQEYDVRNANAGLQLEVNQVEDNDGDGFEYAGFWSAEVGALGAYWPQQLITTLILNGATANSGVAYDGQNYFQNATQTGHYVNPKQTGAGVYFNWFTGAASGEYPGALPIDESVSLDTAFKNMGKFFSYVASIKMPNGVTPRFLRPRRLAVGPRLMPRALQLTNAKYIAQAASSGGGSGDVSSIIQYWGFLQPIEIQELAGATSADSVQQDLTWYCALEELRTSQLGAFVYVDREPFRVTYYTGQGGGTGVDAILDRARELEWHIQGRNVSGYGHPYAFHRIDPT